MTSKVTQAEVSLDAIARNFERIRERVGRRVHVMGVVKADAYGHGALPVARALVEAGASWLGVALPEEGVSLRRQGVTVPILVMGPTPPDHGSVLLEYRLDQMVYHPLHARALSEVRGDSGARLRVHLKVDTGMGRLGILPSEAPAAAREIVQMPRLEFAGIMTHFAAADALDQGHARLQQQRFLEAVREVEAAGVTVPLRHAANSAALLALPETHLDMMRPGIALYGYPPVPAGPQGSWGPALTLTPPLPHIKKVPTRGNG